eukprot:gene14305-20286_t
MIPEGSMGMCGMCRDAATPPASPPASEWHGPRQHPHSAHGSPPDAGTRPSQPANTIPPRNSYRATLPTAPHKPAL